MVLMLGRRDHHSLPRRLAFSIVGCCDEVHGLDEVDACSAMRGGKGGCACQKWASRPRARQGA